MTDLANDARPTNAHDLHDADPPDETPDCDAPKSLDRPAAGFSEIGTSGLAADSSDNIEGIQAQLDRAATTDRLSDVAVTAARALRWLGIGFVRRYNRLQIDVEAADLDEPVLFVANHGFGGIFDLNVFATLAAFDQLGLTRPVTILTHQLAWTLKVGPLIEALGARPASRTTVEEAFAAGRHVMVMPGGDIDAAKGFLDRNKIVFSGRTGYASLAAEHGVPIIPIVTAGAGESLFVLSSGRRLARVTRSDRVLRLKALPVSVSLPWGISFGAVGMLPYFPLPTKLHTRVLAAAHLDKDETPAQLAARVEKSMQDALTDLTRNRRLLLG